LNSGRLFTELTSDDLSCLADAIERGRLTSPFNDAAISKLGLSNSQSIAKDLQGLSYKNLGDPQVEFLLRCIEAERRERVLPTEELVITGPDVDGCVRDTSVVVEQLFSEAQTSVLMAWYALYDGRSIFQTLSQRMESFPDLNVRLCLDISRQGSDTTRDDDIVARFSSRFLKFEWPGTRLPQVYYDPRGLQLQRKTRAVLHAKCIVIDGRKALVTSANPTPAAYHRNIELGIILENSDVPQQIEKYFSSLIDAEFLKRLHLS
jgi:hypothetical protein